MTLRRWMLMIVVAVAMMIASVGVGAASADNFLGQGFDKCEIATLSQMQNWITNSPYRAVNLYIGGSTRSCSNLALTSSYVSQLSQQGWKFIPTWVGPQSAGWSGSSSSRINNDPATAYNQGVSEANAAINVSINLGLASADGSGTIIYYDLENYDTTNTVYRNAAKSFISGWTAQLHTRGSKAGVYGSSCGSAISDFASISNIPDAIWPAHWLTPYQYRSDATVWDVACLSNGIWGNHQRIRQYAGGHSETWGGVTLNIDSNVIDGIVASSLPTISEKSLLRVDTQIEVYWLQNGKLYWITDWEIINQMSGIPGWAGDSVNILPVSVFNPATYPQGPRFITSTSEGMLIQENGAIDVYLISGGMRHYITYELFVSEGYDFADVIIVSPQIMNAITKGSDISTPPNTPISPAPSNGATNQPTTPTLSWTGGDPDGDLVTYTVYLGTSSNPTTQICSGTSTSCSVSGLSYSTKYYWNVVASDGKTSPVTGPVWSFTTQAQPDFAISITPSSQSIVQGALTSYSISLISENGFNSAVSLSASVLPSGVTASFNPVSVTPTGSSTLTIQTSASTPVGSYPLTINGTGGGKIHDETATLSVTAACGLTGDLNCDGIVDMNEIFIAIDAFAAGTLDMDYIFAAIDAFAATA